MHFKIRQCFICINLQKCLSFSFRLVNRMIMFHFPFFFLKLCYFASGASHARTRGGGGLTGHRRSVLQQEVCEEFNRVSRPALFNNIRGYHRQECSHTSQTAKVKRTKNGEQVNRTKHHLSTQLNRTVIIISVKQNSNYYLS